MSKIIVSLPLLRDNFVTVAFTLADKLATEKKLDKIEVSKALNDAIGHEDFKLVYEKYFGDEVKIIMI